MPAQSGGQGGPQRLCGREAGWRTSRLPFGADEAVRSLGIAHLAPMPPTRPSQELPPMRGDLVRDIHRATASEDAKGVTAHDSTGA